MLLIEKKDSAIKEQIVTNGSRWCSHALREETNSCTVATNSLLLSRGANAKENYNTITLDILKTFTQRDMPRSTGSK